jgi:hypothetical protein
MELAEELTGVSFSKEINEQQFGKESVELESATEWPVNVIGDERNMGDKDDLPLEKHEELQLSRLRNENQPGEQLEEVIDPDFMRRKK